MRVPLFTDLGLYLVGSLMIGVRLRASILDFLDCRTARVLSISQFRSHLKLVVRTVWVWTWKV